MNRFKIEVAIVIAFVVGIMLTAALQYWGIIHLPQRAPVQAASPLQAEAQSIIDAVAAAKRADMKKLEGAYCIQREGNAPTCLRWGEQQVVAEVDPVATSIFLRYFWKNVPDELKAQTLHRMQIMPPFEEGTKHERTPGLMQSRGCVFLKCSAEQVGFYFEIATGGTAFTLRRNGTCEVYSDDAFQSRDKLC